MLADDTWETVLETLKQDGKFRLEELPFEGGELAAVATILRRLERKDWVRQEQEWWLPGKKAQLLMDLNDSTPVTTSE